MAETSYKSLGLRTATALVAGSMLGIGIFIAPPIVAGHVNSVGAFYALWVIGGTAALCGALSVAELGAMLPRGGGDYPYLRMAYGPGLAFAAGWLQLLAIFPGSLATMALGTARYQLPVLLGDLYEGPTRLLGFSGPDAAQICWAALIVLGLTAINHLGIALSGRVQLALTVVPITVLVVTSVVIIAGVGGASVSVTNTPALGSGSDIAGGGWAGLALAYLPVYFAFAGWNAAIYVGGEIEQPARTLPRALLFGTLAVTLLYLLLCWGFLTVFSLPELATVGEAGTATAARTFGAIGRVLVTILILLAMLGSINGSVMTGSRIARAMAEQGHAPAAAKRTHRMFGTPVVALWGQAAWTLVLLSWQGFEQLMDYTSSAMLITGCLTVSAVIVLRRRMPKLSRPYKVWGYPWPPIFYVFSSAAVLTVSIVQWDPSVFLAVLWFAGALAVHRFLVH